jgi:hypothetical protein
VSYPVPRPEEVLPDVDGLEVAVDVESSGKHPDDGARIAIVSVAFRRPDDGEPWGYAFPFDQGNLPGKPEYEGKQATLFELEDQTNLDLDAWVHLCRWLRRQRLIMHPVLFDVPMIRAGTRHAAEDRRWTGPDLIDQCWWDTQVRCKEMYPMHPQGLKENAVRLELLKDTKYVVELYGGWRPGIEAEDQKLVRTHLERIKVRRGGSAYSTGRWDLGDWNTVGPYAALDALETLLLKERQDADLERGQDGSLGLAVYHAGRWLDRERRKTKVLYLMQQRGIGFDTGRCLDAAAEIRKVRDQVATELPFRPTTDAARVYFFGPNSQLIPYDVTERGKPKMDAEIVAKMVRDRVPHADTWQTWIQLDNALTKWYEAYPNMTGPDGRLRTVFRQTQVRSGRTSVERVNLQAMVQDYMVEQRLAKVGKIPSPRGCVVAKRGTQLWSFDLAQAELRTAAKWAPCPRMIELVTNPAYDAHGQTATDLFAVRPGDPDWMMYRQVAKRGNFSLIFGVGAETFQATLSKYVGLEWPVDRCQDAVTKWRRLYPEFGWAINRCAQFAQRKRYVQLKNGRLSWFNHLDLLQDGDCHKAFNRFVQASLAELGAELMVVIEQRWPGMLVNWVHDAAYLEIPVERVDEVKAEVAELGAEMFEQMMGIPGEFEGHLEAA